MSTTDVAVGAVCAIRKSCEFLFYVRGREFQNSSRRELIYWHNAIDEHRVRLGQESRTELWANRLYGLQCLVLAYMDELEMWIRLKREEAHDAYVALVDSQSALAVAQATAPPCLAHPFDQHAKRLQALEKLLFPPQKHVSAVIVSGPSRCTICGQFYDCCTHLVGQTYAGQLCQCQCGEISHMENCDLVDSPDDKAARLLTVPCGDVQRDVMTWREVEGEANHSRVCVIRTSREIPVDL